MQSIDVYSMTGNPGETVNDTGVKSEFFKKFFLNNGRVVNVEETLGINILISLWTKCPQTFSFLWTRVHKNARRPDCRQG